MRGVRSELRGVNPHGAAQRVNCQRPADAPRSDVSRMIVRPLARAIRCTLVLPVLLYGCASNPRPARPVYWPPPPARPRVVFLKAFNGVGDLVARRWTLGEALRGTASGPRVQRPAGLAFRDGHIYICDGGSSTVHDWNLVTGDARRLGGEGSALLSKPVAVTVDEQGTVFVADTELQRVVAFQNAGTTRTYRPADRPSYRPVAVAVHGGHLYVADLATHQIDCYGVESGELTASIGGVGKDTGRFYFPMGVATANDGTLYASDMMNGRVQSFSASGEFLSTMGQPGDRYGDLGKPCQMAVAPDGTLFVADPEFARIHIFDGGGRLLMLLGGAEDGSASLPLPVGVAVADSLPESLAAWPPPDFRADYYLFTASSLGEKRLALYAIGEPH